MKGSRSHAWSLPKVLFFAGLTGAPAIQAAMPEIFFGFNLDLGTSTSGGLIINGAFPVVNQWSYSSRVLIVGISVRGAIDGPAIAGGGGASAIQAAMLEVFFRFDLGLGTSTTTGGSMK
jgi:hypothetical protein